MKTNQSTLNRLFEPCSDLFWFWHQMNAQSRPSLQSILWTTHPQLAVSKTCLRIRTPTIHLPSQLPIVGREISQGEFRINPLWHPGNKNLKSLADTILFYPRWEGKTSWSHLQDWKPPNWNTLLREPLATVSINAASQSKWYWLKRTYTLSSKQTSSRWSFRAQGRQSLGQDLSSPFSARARPPPQGQVLTVSSSDRSCVVLWSGTNRSPMFFFYSILASCCHYSPAVFIETNRSKVSVHERTQFLAFVVSKPHVIFWFVQDKASISFISKESDLCYDLNVIWWNAYPSSTDRIHPWKPW